MDVTIGNYELLFFKTIIGVENLPIIIPFENIKFKIIFLDNNDSKQDVEYVAENNSTLKLVLKNFKNALGTGNVEPIHVGRHNNKNLFVMFRVYHLAEGMGKTLFFELLAKEKDGEK